MPFSDYETIPQLIAAMMRQTAKLSGWTPPPPGKDSEIVGPLMFKCISWEPSGRPTARELDDSLWRLYKQEDFNNARSGVIKDSMADVKKAGKIRSEAKIDIDIALALEALEVLL
jgi:hypothetical protein